MASRTCAVTRLGVPFERPPVLCLRHVWQRALVDRVSMQPASDAYCRVLDDHLADLMDRRQVSEVGYVFTDFLGMRSERCLVGVERVTQEVAHGDICAERLSLAVHERLVDGVYFKAAPLLLLISGRCFVW